MGVCRSFSVTCTPPLDASAHVTMPPLQLLQRRVRKHVRCVAHVLAVESALRPLAIERPIHRVCIPAAKLRHSFGAACDMDTGPGVNGVKVVELSDGHGTARFLLRRGVRSR